MPNLDTLARNNHSSYIGLFSDSELPESELEVRRVWQSLPLDRANYFAVLDSYTLEDEFYVALRSTAEQKLYSQGIIRVGDLIALSADELAVQSGMTADEMAKVTRVLTRMGLSLDTDTAQWRAYRETVDSDFRLRWPLQSKLPKDTRNAFEI